MSKKIKLFSLICFIVAIAFFTPNISNAYETEEEVPINYTIKINKIDSADNMNLQGAKFQLKDVNGKVLQTQTTDENGILNFGNIKTFGSGTDIYFIDEIRTPKGYVLDEKETIEVDVQKTITNVETGAYNLKIMCQTLNYSTDITRYDFVPVSTVDQLKAIGSNAEFTYEGKKYIYTDSTNYRLMNDIDLSGIEWEPINVPVSGIFDGNGHSIKNLTITSETEIDYKEVGLFKSYSGIVSDLKMENVNIKVPGYTEDATSITEKSGVGAFAGYMGSGTFKNCSVSGTINACVSNVGGLVGHSAEEIIIKFQDCINNANITVSKSSEPLSKDVYNVGGLIGCAVCSLSLTDCTNNGQIDGNAGNVGSLVGYVESDGYEEKTIKAGYAEDGNTITLLIGNSRIDGEYDLYLEDYDLRTLNILPGGVFTVYDASLEPVEGFENVTLTDGKLKIGTVNIRCEGKDTYFVKDVTPVDGYRKISGYIKIVVTRYWDFEEERFRVTVDEEVIAEDKIQDEIGSNTEELDSITDTFAPSITFEDVGWNNAKATFVRCTNNQTVKGRINAGGLIGRANVRVTMNECTNTANVGAYDYGKAGGMIGELTYWNKGVMSELNNCTNTALVESNSNSTGSAGGMIAQCITDIKLTHCTNTGKIQASGSSAAGGMISDATGNIYMDSCSNSGEINALKTNDCDVHAGGMIAKNISKTYIYGSSSTSTTIQDTSKNNVRIINCTNTGNLSSGCHLGGIIGYSEANSLVVEGCEVKGVTITDIYQADKGGIAGYLEVTDVSIKDCTVDEIDLKRTSGSSSTTYGVTGGIVGNWCNYGNMSRQLQSMEVSGCNVINSDIQTKGQSTAGIIGACINSSSEGSINIHDCLVSDSTILNDETSSTYTSSAGILAMSYAIDDVVIDKCDVVGTSVTSSKQSSYTSDQDVGGIAGMLHGADTYKITNCNVTNGTITNNSGTSDTCANASGIVAWASGRKSDSKLLIEKCDVTGTEITTVEGNCAGVIGSTGYYYSNDYPIEVNNVNIDGCKLYSTAVGGSNSTISGMVGYACSSISVTNGTVNGTNITIKTNPNSGSNTAGFLGMSQGKGYFNNCKITDSDLLSDGSSYSRCACVAGIAGTCGNGAEFIDCSVLDTTCTGNAISDGAPTVANVAGILGCSYSSSQDAIVQGCTVKGSTMYSEATATANNSNSSVAGIIGVASSVVVTDSIVEDCDITGSGMVTAGVVGCAYNNSSLTNVEVSDINIVDNGSNKISDIATNVHYRSIGGIIASSGGQFTGSNLKSNGVNITSQSVSIGGIAGSIRKIVDLSNSTVDGLTITNDPFIKGNCGTAAALVGDVYTIAEDATISQCGVSNSNASTKFGNISGFIGTFTGDNGSKLTIDDASVTDTIIVNTNENNYGITGEAAGILSYTEGEVTVNNSEVTSCTIKEQVPESSMMSGKHIAGLVAYANKSITVNNANMSSNEIINETSGQTGGMVGFMLQNKNNETYDINVSDSNIDNVSIVGTGHAGMIAGISNKVTVTGTDITNSQINTNDVSGIMIGLPYDRVENTITVSDCDITESSVSSKNQAGAVVGFVSSTINVSQMVVSKVSIESSQACAGGLIGNTNNVVTATDISLGDIEVKSMNHAGGIVGFSKGLEVTDITINDSKITCTNYLAGGVAGIVQGTVNADNVKLLNNTQIKGRDNTGGIVGYVSNNVTVDNPTISDITVTSESGSAGGMVGVMNSTFDVENATINNINVVGAYIVGGIAGCAGNITTSGITANDIEITNNGAYLTGGLFGVANKLDISDSSLSGANVTGKNNIGGFIGYATITANNNTIEDVELTMSDGSNGGSGIGGLIGVTNYNSSIDGVTASNITLHPRGVLAGGIAGLTSGNMSDINITGVNINADSNYSNVGGIVGVLSGTLSSSTVDDAHLYGFSDGSIYGDIGGAVGCASDKIDDVRVTNSEIKSQKQVGGIAGVSTRDITNSSVEGCVIEVVSQNGTASGSIGNAGGIAGCSSSTISEVNVTDTEIKSTNEAGGVVGIANGTITNSSVNECDIKIVNENYTAGSGGGDAGGIAGCASSNIDDVHVTGTTIKSLKEVGGIVGVANGNVTDSSVDDCEVEVTEKSYTLERLGGDAGGAVGATQRKVESVSVTNTTVISSKLAGGVVGAGYVSTINPEIHTELEDLTVDNNTLSATKVGKYIGAPELYDDNEYIPNTVAEQTISNLQPEYEISNNEEISSQERASETESIQDLKKSKTAESDKVDFEENKQETNEENDDNQLSKEDSKENEKIQDETVDEQSDVEENTDPIENVDDKAESQSFVQSNDGGTEE